MIYNPYRFHGDECDTSSKEQRIFGYLARHNDVIVSGWDRRFTVRHAWKLIEGLFDRKHWQYYYQNTFMEHEDDSAESDALAKYTALKTKSGTHSASWHLRV